MKHISRITSVILASVMAGTMAVGSASSPASALSNPHVMSSAEESFTVNEMKQLERDIETLFTRYVVQSNTGRFEVRYENIYADGVEQYINDFEGLAENFNAVGYSAIITEPTNTFGGSTLALAAQPQGAGEFAWCVLSRGLGVDIIKNAPGLLAATRTAIAAWNWGLAATTVARILGPSVVRTLGGPWSIAAALGIAAYNCRDKL